jgi:hypothetical protein
VGNKPEDASYNWHGCIVENLRWEAPTWCLIAARS